MCRGFKYPPFFAAETEVERAEPRYQISSRGAVNLALEPFFWGSACWLSHEIKSILEHIGELWSIVNRTVILYLIGLEVHEPCESRGAHGRDSRCKSKRDGCREQHYFPEKVS